MCFATDSVGPSDFRAAGPFSTETSSPQGVIVWPGQFPHQLVAVKVQVAAMYVVGQMDFGMTANGATPGMASAHPPADGPEARGSASAIAQQSAQVQADKVPRGSRRSSRRPSSSRQQRPVPDPRLGLGPALEKTKLCKFFDSRKECLRGSECHFAHGFSELRKKPNLFRTMVCRSYATSGGCRFGSGCRFAHTAEELRPRVVHSSPNLGAIDEDTKQEAPKDWVQLELGEGSRSQTPTTDEYDGYGSDDSFGHLAGMSGVLEAVDGNRKTVMYELDDDLEYKEGFISRQTTAGSLSSIETVSVTSGVDEDVELALEAGGRFAMQTRNTFVNIVVESPCAARRSKSAHVHM